MSSIALINDQRDDSNQREISDKKTPSKLSPSKIPTMEEILMKQLMKFYSLEYNRKQMLPIVCGSSKVSLRVLDWFATNYAKQYNIIYSIKKQTRVRQFSVYTSYKAQLKTFSKKVFDPFCRRQRIYFEYAEDEGVETTVAQLNFFRWAIENKVIDYVEAHLDEIINDMNMRGSKPHKGVDHKKRELSVSATKSINQHDVKITVKFDLEN